MCQDGRLYDTEVRFVLRISPHGRREVAIACLVFGALAFGLGSIHLALGVVPLVGIVAIAGFFRDPRRSVPDGAGLLVSPADGKVADIGEVEESEFVRGRAVRIGIFLSVFNVHVNRAPCAGQVEYVRHRPGKFGAAFTAESTRDNESNALGLRTAVGDPILVRQITGAIARRIVCAVAPGDALARGERFGLIKFGSRTEVFVPIEKLRELRVRVGDKVRGGSDVLALLETADSTSGDAS